MELRDRTYEQPQAGYQQGRRVRELPPTNGPDTTAWPMTPTSPKTSSRLVRAAAAERADLDRHRERLTARRDDLQDELEQVERALADVDDRVALLNRLAPAEATGNGNGRPADLAGDTPVGPGQQLLRGTAIREMAVRLLAESAEAGRPVHYKRVFDMLGGAGFAVGGKDPLATFLTQFSRSPLVRKTSKAGIYEFDREAPERLRRRLGELQTELRAATTTSANGDLAEVRKRRDKVLADIAQVERALDEASRVLEVEAPPAARGAA